MSEKQKDTPPNPNQDQSATLGDVLSLEATIEAFCKDEVVPGFLSGGIRDISPTERIAINHTPAGEESGNGNVISHVSLTQRQADGSYKGFMNYIVIRDGDETTTKVIKRTPFTIPSLEETFQGHDPFSPEGAAGHQEAVERLTDNIELYDLAIHAGLYDVSASELQQLVTQINTVYQD